MLITVQAIVDVYSFLLLLGNALSRSRMVSQKLLDTLIHDGLYTFLVSLPDMPSVAVTDRNDRLDHFM